MQKVEISGKTYNFIYYEESKCWLSKIEIDGIEIEIEIDMDYYIQNEVDWKHFEQFLIYISSKNCLQEFVKYGYKPIEEIGNAFFRRCSDEIKGWKMLYSNSIIFRGHPKGMNYKANFEFSLVFDFIEKKENGSIDGDAYGLYLVDITSNEGINGARRIQC
jgi:hypothetical protein